MNRLNIVDPEIAHWLEKELVREITTIELIASENFVYPSVLEAQGSVLTNKYAEGYPGRRYHGGCEYIDPIESIGIERAKKLFGAEHANIQPHSGVNANLAAFMALLNPGDTIMGMNLQHGGHLSHGSRVSIVGRFYNAVDYGVSRETELIDYDEVESIAKKHRPKLIIAGASAYSRIIDFKAFRDIADSVGAYFMVDMAHIAGLVAAGLHPSPVPYADIVTSTTTKTMRGARGGIILCKEKYAEKVDKAIFPGIQGGPILPNLMAKAVTFKIAMTEQFREYQGRVIKNARRMAENLARNGFRIVSGGTDNHLMLVDLRPIGITGQQAEELLQKVGITVNKNMIPYDTTSPAITSGIRIGVAAVTSRGFMEEDIDKVAEIIIKLLKNANGGADLDEYRERVLALCRKHPLYLEPFEMGGMLD
ncbi:MAG: serine hydroxymethyltransferase [Clostridiales bacterium]|nr:serine hydroxymethyltransferase [Clostridiales bacterium]